ncbi:MAG: ribonuclease PH [Myxococcota bacterium]
MTRTDGRSFDALRPVAIELGVQKRPEGSLIYRSGETTVLVAASVDERTPDWRQPGLGWLTAEYAMHPRANPSRRRREGRRGGGIDGRSAEIQRLIGRSLRAMIDFTKLGDRTITVDCDVLDADGGTRTASICGGTVAVALALGSLQRQGLVRSGVLRAPLQAISVGLVSGRPLLDLCYVEDRDAEVDLNVVGTADGRVVEVQGTAEEAPVARADIDGMLDLALASFAHIADVQKAALADAGVDVKRLTTAAHP